MIQITHIVPPESGWPVAIYCDQCRVTEFVRGVGYNKPLHRDYFLIAGCLNGHQHNLRIREMTCYQGRKLPIDRPCSACSAGDYAMEHHDHMPPFRGDL
jgi:hypothetical protein